MAIPQIGDFYIQNDNQDFWLRELVAGVPTWVRKGNIRDEGATGLVSIQPILTQGFTLGVQVDRWRFLGSLADDMGLTQTATVDRIRLLSAANGEGFAVSVVLQRVNLLSASMGLGFDETTAITMATFIVGLALGISMSVTLEKIRALALSMATGVSQASALDRIKVVAAAMAEGFAQASTVGRTRLLAASMAEGYSQASTLTLAASYTGPPLLIFGMYSTSPFVEFLAGSSYTKMADPATLPATTLQALDRSPNGRWVAVGGATSPIKIYDMSSGAPVYSTSIALTSPNVTCIRFSPDSSKLLVQNNDTTVRIYNTSTWALTSFTAPASVYAIAWSADGSQFAIGMPSTPYLKLYDTATLAASATQPAVPPTTQVTALAWSPDGSHLAVGAVTSFLIVYRTDTWAKIANPSTMPTNYPGAFSSNTMAWSPDSSRLAFVTPTTPYVWSYTLSGHTLTYEASPSVLPTSPAAIVISADGGKAFVANGASTPNWIMTYLLPGWTRGTDPVSQGPANSFHCSIN